MTVPLLAIFVSLSQITMNSSQNDSLNLKLQNGWNDWLRRAWDEQKPFSTFPEILHHLLEEAETSTLNRDELKNIISWEPHGYAFKVRDKKRFMLLIMPKYFRTNQYPSFQRNLNHYGFKRLRGEGSSKGAYFHESFLRGVASRVSSMRRIRTAAKIRTYVPPDKEPDFFALPPLPPAAKHTVKRSLVVPKRSHIWRSENEADEYAALQLFTDDNTTEIIHDLTIPLSVGATIPPAADLVTDFKFKRLSIS